MTPEQELSASLLVAFRADFSPEREATALQFAELLLDAVAAALPLTRHEPAEPALAQLEGLTTQLDLYSWDGPPGWDVVLQRGLLPHAPLTAGASVLDGLGASADRAELRGELKRRARAEAARLVALGRAAARLGARDAVLEEMPSLDAAQTVIAAHATLLRLCACGAVAPLVALPEDVGPLPEGSEAAVVAEIDARGADGFAGAQEEWLALLLKRNPAAAAAPAFRTFYAGLSQALRTAVALRTFRDDARAGRLASADDAEALLGAVAGWQPIRWQSLRAGAPPAWIAQLCPEAPAAAGLERLARECSAALELAGRLWSASGASAAGLASLAALFVARCASAVALWEELGGGVSGV